LVVIVGQKKAIVIAVTAKPTGRRWPKLRDWLAADGRRESPCEWARLATLTPDLTPYVLVRCTTPMFATVL
jgi:hypothetical protein